MPKKATIMFDTDELVQALKSAGLSETVIKTIRKTGGEIAAGENYCLVKYTRPLEAKVSISSTSLVYVINENDDEDNPSFKMEIIGKGGATDTFGISGKIPPRDG